MNQREQELLKLAEEEGIRLPMAVSAIVWFESMGYVVDLVTGVALVAPVDPLPTACGVAIAHLLKDHEGGLAL